MGDETAVRELHEMATQGQVLPEADRARLEAWYGKQDAEEGTLFASSMAVASVSGLQSEVEAATAQLLTVTQHVQSLVEENEALRREITSLSQQLMRTASLQPA